MQSKENEAIVSLYMSYKQSIRAYCVRLLHGQRYLLDIVDDTVQEVYVKALSATNDLASHTNPAGWLHKTCYHIMVPKLIKRRKQALTTNSLDRVELTHPIISQTATTETWLDAECARELLQALKQNMSETESRVFTDYFVDGFKMSEIASRMGTSLSSVKQYIFSIRSKAKKLRTSFTGS